MKLIAKITDDDIGEKLYKINNPTIRKAVRTILLNNNGEIAILYKTLKNEYKLIGGGIENVEEPNKALEREALEESGCKIKIIKELGYTEEYKSQDNFVQTSYIYLSKVLEDTKKLHLTKDEEDDGSKLYWFKPNIALLNIYASFEKLKPSQHTRLYSSKFIIKRDEAILKYYIENEL